MTKNDKSLQIIIFIMLVIILSLTAICKQEPFPEMSPEKCTNYNELFKEKTDSISLSKDLIIATKNLCSEDKREFDKNIKEILESRKESLKELIQNNPKKALSILPPPIEILKDLSKEELNELIEKRMPVEGQIEIFQEEDIETNGCYEEILLTTNSKSIKLFGEIPNIPCGTKAKVKGILIDEIMAFEDEEESFIILDQPRIVNESNQNFGLQNTLVLIGTDIEGYIYGAGTVGSGAIDRVNESIFSNENGSLNDYYLKNSYGQVWFEGDILGPQMLTEEELRTRSKIRTALLEYAILEGINITQYKRIIFGHPQPTEDTGWCGIATRGITFNYELPNGELANFSSAWVKVSILSPRVLFHEVGHNFGMGHAKRLICHNDDSLGMLPISDFCSVGTYTDYMDVMGGATMAYYNAQHKHEVGWLGDENTLTTSKGTYTLYSTDDQNNSEQLKLLRIPIYYENEILQFNQDNVITIDFRKINSYYNNPFHEGGYVNTSLEAQGVHIRYAREAKNKEFTMMPTGLIISEYNISNIFGEDINITINRHAFLQGETFTDPYNGVNITVDEVTEDYATVTVNTFKIFDEEKPLLNYTFNEEDLQNYGSYNPEYFYFNPILNNGANYYEDKIFFNGTGSLEIGSIGKYTNGIIKKEDKFTLMFNFGPTTFPTPIMKAGYFDHTKIYLTEKNGLEVHTLFEGNSNQEEGEIILKSPNINFNNDTHIAITYSGSELKLYIDGSLEDMATNYSDIPLNEANLITKTYDDKFIMGNEDKDEDYGFNGYIDNFLIYAKALSEEEISKYGETNNFKIQPQTPNYGDAFNYENISFMVSVTNDNEIEYCKLFLNNQNISQINNPELGLVDFGTFYISEEQSNGWYVSCNDIEGNTSESIEWRFSTDYTNPTYNIIYSNYLKTGDTGGTFVMVAEWEDETPNYIELLENNNNLLSQEWTYYEQTLALWTIVETNNQKTFNARGTDRAGNQLITEDFVVNALFNEPEPPNEGGNDNNGGNSNDDDSQKLHIDNNSQNQTNQETKQESNINSSKGKEETKIYDLIDNKIVIYMIIFILALMLYAAYLIYYFKKHKLHLKKIKL